MTLTNNRDTRKLTELWTRLGDISIDEDEGIEQSFLHFPIGTDRMDVWHWFDAQGFKFPWIDYD